VARTLASQQPSTAAGRHAQTLIVSALKGEATAFQRLDDALGQVLKGNKARAKKLAKRAESGIATAVKKARQSKQLVDGLTPAPTPAPAPAPAPTPAPASAPAPAPAT
jgi:hypothetical protein